MKRKSTFKSLLALALAVVLVFSTNVTPASAAKKKAKATNAVKSVKVVSPAGTKKIATVARGKSIKLTVIVKAKKKAFKKVTYKSSNAKVATVSKKGIVKGKKVGTTTIKVVSVKNKKKTASIKVKVVKNAVKKVTLNKKNLDLAVGASEKLSAKVNAPKKSYKAVKWTSSNEKVVKVSNKGVVSAVGEGTAKVTVTALDGSKKKATCKVAVWNGIKDVQLNNPRNNYYVDSYKVVLDTPIALTKDSFVVKSKVRAEGTYNRELEVEKVFTNDNLNYTIFTKNSVEMGEFVQVSVPSLKGKNAVELQALADGYEYRQLVSGVVGDEINTGVGFKNLVGYETVSVADAMKHIVAFTSGIWQIHPFGEGNTRTTAVFTIKYLRSIGFDVNNDLFADNSWYFRNALVRANYRNVRKGVESDMSFLILFFRNLMIGENNELKNRTMIINAPQKLTEQVDRTSTEQVPNMLTEQLSAPLTAIIKAIGTEQYSLKALMEKIGLKHRPTFITNYLTPAIQSGFVTLLYPNNPKHPRQKYLLTVKGLAVFNSHK